MRWRGGLWRSEGGGGGESDRHVGKMAGKEMKRDENGGRDYLQHLRGSREP